MKTFTIEDIRSWDPCYDPSRYLPEGWSGTSIDILKNESIPFKDRLWVVLRTELVSERTMGLFAVWCYRQTLKFITDPDTRSIEAASVAERYANGHATPEELSASESEAWEAATAAARSSAGSAMEAAWSARSAAWSATRSTKPTESSARLAACSAVESAARSAAWSSAESAMEAAWLAASTMEIEQKEKLIEMILEENRDR